MRIGVACSVCRGNFPWPTVAGLDPRFLASDNVIGVPLTTAVGWLGAELAGCEFGEPVLLSVYRPRRSELARTAGDELGAGL